MHGRLLVLEVMGINLHTASAQPAVTAAATDQGAVPVLACTLRLQSTASMLGSCQDSWQEPGTVSKLLADSNFHACARVGLCELLLIKISSGRVGRAPASTDEPAGLG